MSTKQLIIFIGMVAFIAFGVWLQFRINSTSKKMNGNTTRNSTNGLKPTLIDPIL